MWLTEKEFQNISIKILLALYIDNPKMAKFCVCVCGGGGCFQLLSRGGPETIA